MNPKTLLPLLFVVCTLGVSAQSNPLQTGDALPALSLKDQHDNPASLPADVRQIIFAADNAGAGLAGDWLDAQPKDWLTRTRRVYLADIHKMPGLIARMFALPKLRDKPYSIVLGRQEADLAVFPRRKDCVTLLPVNDGKVGEASYACDAASLQAALK
ncbi:MAG: hypothetical protein LWW83_06970 [Azonexaceae bacterium]|uniref:hypothetical protein n=1 Tax=Azonexus sp. R2A61 TaxID=2744443 RepID=UPI001F2D5844|nr:hypothetical protein [Azonexus sp. R2A61]MCE1239638.1 hypothetical protein [Azonexaceae bacterium]